MGPASKRTKQAALIHLLVSHFYRQRCCQIIYGFFCCCCCFKKIPRPCRMERVLATWEGGGVGSGPSTHCGLTATLWTRSKLVLTSLQTGKIHLSALESMQTPRPQSSEPHPIHLPKNLLLKLPQCGMEKEMATHSSTLAWRIPGMEEPGGLPSMGSHRVGHDWSNLAAAAARWGELKRELQAQCPQRRKVIYFRNCWREIPSKLEILLQ